MKRNWLDVVVAAAAALLTVALADYLLHSVAPPKKLREVEHGVRDLRQGDPAVLVLGSSHARTFHAVGQELARRAGAALVAVPVENGRFGAYEWVLRHRLAPIVDQREAAGRPARPRLRRFVLLTEWWDSCTHAGPHWNLPGRAWELEDFAADLLHNGITSYNRNYLQNRFRVLFADSALVNDRTQQALLPKVGRLLRGKPLHPTPEEEQRFVVQWQRMVEAGARCMNDPVQMAALRSILEFARSRGWDTTVILFPRKPATLTAQAKATTLAGFAGRVRELATPAGARVVDLTYRSPLGDADFMEDFDHVTETGNREFARWVLDHDLKFLLEPPGTR